MRTRGVLVGIAAVALLSWQGAAAQSGTPHQGQGTQAQPGSQAQPGHTGTAGHQAGTSGQTAKVADSSFIMEAAEGGMMEVELGKLAESKAENAEVKQFGQRMVSDHGKANDELSALAKQKGVTLPTELPKKHAAAKTHLEGLSGAAFDRAYMQHMVSDHAKDVKAFQTESKTGKDADVKAWAAKTLPTLEEHLKLSREVAGKVGASKPSGMAKPGTEKPGGEKH